MDISQYIKEDKETIKSKFKSYQDNDLFDIYKKAILNNDSLDFLCAYPILKSRFKENSKLKPILELYHNASFIFTIGNILKEKEGLTKLLLVSNNKSINFNEKFTIALINCMTETCIMYQENKISYEDLMNIEKAIDHLNIKDLHISNRQEVEKMYCRFKGYCLNKFLELNQ